MLTSELLDFIKEQLSSGMSRDEMSALLLSEGGWTKADIEEAFLAVAPAPPVVPISVPSTPPATTVQPPQPVPSQLPPQPAVQPTQPVQPPVSEIRPQQPSTSQFETQTSMMKAMDAGLAAKSTSAPSSSALLGLLQAEEVRSKTMNAPAEDAPVSVAVESNPAVHPTEEFQNTQRDFVSQTAPPPHELAKVEDTHPTPHLTPQPATPYVLPVISKSEDFLGIFDSVTEDTPQPEVAIPIFPLKISAGKDVEIRTQSTKNFGATGAVTHTASDYVLSEQIREGAPHQTIDSSDTIFPPQLPLSDLDGEVKQAPMVKFNLEKVRGPSGEIGELHDSTSKESGVVAQSAHVQSSGPSSGAMSARSAVLGRRTMASDILLQGMGGKSVMPPPKPAVPPTTSVTPPSVPLEQPIKLTKESSSSASAANDVMKKSRTKRVLGVIIIVLFWLAALGAIGYSIMNYMGTRADTVLTSALTNFFSATAFGYHADAKVDLSLSDKSKIERSPSIIKFTVNSKGSLESGVKGYGDGMHDINLSANIQSGNFALPTALEGDVLVQDTTLYFHLRSFPKTSELDPLLFEKYWIKVDLAEIARELALSGVLTPGGKYGSFGGGGSTDDHFVALLKKYNPLLAGKNIASPSDDKNMHHVSFFVNPEKGLEFILATYRKYMGKELVLSDDQRLRLKNSLEKIEGQLWVNKDTDVFERVLLRANLDDVIVNTAVKGSVNIDFVFSDMNAPVTLTTPTSNLTLEELRVEMEKFKSQKVLRLNDQAKIDKMRQIMRALDTYREIKGRYPILLRELYGGNMLSTSTIPEVALGDYYFGAYVNDTSLSKSGRCTTTGKLCDFYHVGVNLEAGDRVLLSEDADQNTDVRGGDDRGCVSQPGLFCYDLVSPKTPEQ